MSYFYGIVWYLAYGSTLSNKYNQGESLMLSQGNHLNFNNSEIDNQNIITWIQTIEKLSSNIAKLQIRDQNALISSILHSNLLYKLT